LLEPVIVEDGKTLQEAVNENIFGVYTDEVDPVGQVRGNVLVHEFESADGNGKKRETLQEFEGSDDQKSAGWLAAHWRHHTLGGWVYDAARLWNARKEIGRSAGSARRSDAWIEWNKGSDGGTGVNGRGEWNGADA
jgi:hypothetical protein